MGLAGLFSECTHYNGLTEAHITINSWLLEIKYECCLEIPVYKLNLYPSVIANMQINSFLLIVWSQMDL